MSVPPAEKSSSIPAPQEIALVVSVGEQLETDYMVHELPSDVGDRISHAPSSSVWSDPASQSTEVLVDNRIVHHILDFSVRLGG